MYDRIFNNKTIALSKTFPYANCLLKNNGRHPKTYSTITDYIANSKFEKR